MTSPSRTPDSNPQEFVALLGTKGGPAVRPGSAMPTSSLIHIGGQQIVVDCGLGVTRGLIDQQVDLRQLKTIMITHLHSDHYLELGPLIHTAWTAGLKTPLNVWGPAGLQTYWDAFCQSMAADIELRQTDEGRPPLAGLVRIHVIDDGTFFDAAELGHRDMSEIPHPFIVESLALMAAWPTAERDKVHFIHLNHTNRLLDPASDATQRVLDAGCHVARFGDRHGL